MCHSLKPWLVPCLMEGPLLQSPSKNVERLDLPLLLLPSVPTNRISFFVIHSLFILNKGKNNSSQSGLPQSHETYILLVSENFKSDVYTLFGRSPFDTFGGLSWCIVFFRSSFAMSHAFIAVECGYKNGCEEGKFSPSPNVFYESWCRQHSAKKCLS